MLIFGLKNTTWVKATVRIFWAVTPFEANLYLLMEWTEGTALGENMSPPHPPQMGTGEHFK